MSRQLFIGLFAEGTTDDRFLKSIVQRTFERIVFDCPGEIEIYDVFIIRAKENSFRQSVMKASQTGIKDYSINALCVHVDADDRDDRNVYANKINPALADIKEAGENVCKIIVPLVTVQMAEAWMLADKECLKREIGTTKSNNELGIDRKPEDYADPKEAIRNAIRIAYQNKPKRRRGNLDLTELYQIIGQSASLAELEQLPSYSKFCEHIESALQHLNYTHHPQ